MRRSEFSRAVADEFGPRAPSIVSDLTLREFGDRTAIEAIDAGVPPRDVWMALCIEMDVPLERRHGAGRLEPKR